MNELNKGDDIGGERKAEEADDLPEITDNMLEDQYVLRLPPALAQRIREDIAKAKEGKEVTSEVFFSIAEDCRKASFSYNGEVYPATLVDLPCVLEAQKTYDKRFYYKAGDIGQMVLVQDIGDPPPEHLSRDSGITPPTRKIRKKNWRKSQLQGNPMKQDFKMKDREIELELVEDVPGLESEERIIPASQFPDEQMSQPGAAAAAAAAGMFSPGAPWRRIPSYAAMYGQFSGVSPASPVLGGQATPIAPAFSPGPAMMTSPQPGRPPLGSPAPPIATVGPAAPIAPSQLPPSRAAMMYPVMPMGTPTMGQRPPTLYPAAAAALAAAGYASPAAFYGVYPGAAPVPQRPMWPAMMMHWPPAPGYPMGVRPPGG